MADNDTPERGLLEDADQSMREFAARVLTQDNGVTGISPAPLIQTEESGFDPRGGILPESSAGPSASNPPFVPEPEPPDVPTLEEIVAAVLDAIISEGALDGYIIEILGDNFAELFADAMDASFHDWFDEAFNTAVTDIFTTVSVDICDGGEVDSVDLLAWDSGAP